jgi:TDG/mug DNA glycosylase family protein
MGTEVLTLADLVPSGQVRAVVVGINPAPPSVAVGHYYQGRLGQQFYARLRQAGVLGPRLGPWDDDDAVEAGLGFTDIVRRPTATAADVRPEEYRHGRARLLEHLEGLSAPLVIFTFKKTAQILMGPFKGHGLLDQRLGSAVPFVMPGPYAARGEVDDGLRALATALPPPS